MFPSTFGAVHVRLDSSGAWTLRHVHVSLFFYLPGCPGGLQGMRLHTSGRSFARPCILGHKKRCDGLYLMHLFPAPRLARRALQSSCVRPSYTSCLHLHTFLDSNHHYHTIKPSSSTIIDNVHTNSRSAPRTGPRPLTTHAGSLCSWAAYPCYRTVTAMLSTTTSLRATSRASSSAAASMTRTW